MSRQPHLQRWFSPFPGVLLMALLSQAMASPVLSAAQQHALVLAYRAAAPYQIGATFAAIVYVESSACKNAVESSAHAFGCAQVKESAAQAVAGVRIPGWMLGDPDEQEMNMAIGARYLDMCLNRFGWPAGIGAYYVGITKALHMTHAQLIRLPYTRSVLTARAWLIKIPLSED